MLVLCESYLFMGELFLAMQQLMISCKHRTVRQLFIAIHILILLKILPESVIWGKNKFHSPAHILSLNIIYFFCFFLQFSWFVAPLLPYDLSDSCFTVDSTHNS